jgi:hypothetical protein
MMPRRLWSVVWLAPVVIVASFTEGCGRSGLPGAGRDAGADPDPGAIADGLSNTWQAPIDGGCPPELTACGQGQGLTCQDVSRSRANCGSCGHACAPGLACESGRCQQYRCSGALSFRILPGIEHEILSQDRPTLADFDGDGVPDLAWLPKSDAAAVMFGKGDGTFVPSDQWLTESAGWYAHAVDIDQDGWLDLISVHYDRSGVIVQRGTGSRSNPFAEPERLDTEANPDGLLVVDIDGDALPDLFAGVGQNLAYWRGMGGGRFSRQPDLASTGASLVVMAADWNRDGVLDLAYGASTLRLRLGQQGGGFADEVACGIALVPELGAAQADLGDVDHDGRPDLITSQAGVVLGLEGCAATQVANVPEWRRTASGIGVTLADMDGDGNLDIVTDLSPGQAGILVGDGQGGFGKPVTIYRNGLSYTSTFAVGDVNRDGKLDVIIQQIGSWAVALNTCR